MLARAGLTGGIGAAGRRRSSTCARPPTSPPAAPRPTSPTSSTRTTATWRCARSARSGSTSAASISSRRTSPRATARSAAASARSTPRPASACTSRPAKARRATSAGPVIDMLFPPGAPSRVPIAAITGTNGKTTTARMLAHIAKMAGYTPGLTTTDGVYIDGQRTVEGDMTGPVSARMVLADPQIDIAVLETARGGLLRAGMGVPEVNVGAVLNVAVRPPRAEGHRHARAAGRGQARRGRSREGLRGAQRRRSARAEDVGLHRREDHLLRHHEPAARAGARAHPRRRPRLRARGGRQRPDDHALRQGQPHPACCGRT